MRLGSRCATSQPIHPGSREPLDKKMGWWASDTATLYFDDVRVPVSNIIGEENQGFKVIMTNFNNERMAMAANMEAYGRVCLERRLSGLLSVRLLVSDSPTIRSSATRSPVKQKLNAASLWPGCYATIGRPQRGRHCSFEGAGE